MSEGQSLFEHEIEHLLNITRQKYGKELYIGPSFPAIVGYGPNGAIVHYRPEEATSSRLQNLKECLLIDTGAHYLNGTTDTTRTLVFSKNNVNSDLSEMYTRVLMGNLDLQETVFPENKTIGCYLEAIARKHLW